LQQTNKKQITTDAISDTAVEKIKRIVSDENAECEVASPMDKLETFFIRTVTAAQQQARPTSGAVSTTRIGDFLTQHEVSESILDKLVSAPISEQASDETPATEKVAAESVKPNADEKLLSKLTSSVEPSESKAVTKEEQIKTEPVESQTRRAEQVKKNILDKLTGGSGDLSHDKDKTEKPQAGDSGDA
jgi:hypothetical protein